MGQADNGTLTFEVDIKKAPGSRLGMEAVFVSSPNGFGLVVERVNAGGALEAWNRRSREPMRVKPGDFIIAVNGIEGDISCLAEELRSGRGVKITVQRAPGDEDSQNHAPKQQASTGNKRGGTTHGSPQGLQGTLEQIAPPPPPLPGSGGSGSGTAPASTALARVGAYAGLPSMLGQASQNRAAPSPAPAPDFSFEVHLVKPEGAKLGIDIQQAAVVLQSGAPEGLPCAGLRVKHISPGGMVESWNQRSEPACKIRAGDYIVCVNSVANDYGGMMEELRTRNKLRITMLRCNAGASAPTASNYPAVGGPAPAGKGSDTRPYRPALTEGPQPKASSGPAISLSGAQTTSAGAGRHSGGGTLENAAQSPAVALNAMTGPSPYGNVGVATAVAANTGPGSHHVASANAVNNSGASVQAGLLTGSIRDRSEATHDNDGPGGATCFEVILEPCKGKRVGIDVILMSGNGLSGFVIERITKGGRVDLWNRTSQPPHKVLPGDYIVEVNGYSSWSELPRMAEEFTKANEQLRFCVQRNPRQLPIDVLHQTEAKAKMPATPAAAVAAKAKAAPKAANAPISPHMMPFPEQLTGTSDEAHQLRATAPSMPPQPAIGLLAPLARPKEAMAPPVSNTSLAALLGAAPLPTQTAPAAPMLPDAPDPHRDASNAPMPKTSLAAATTSLVELLGNAPPLPSPAGIVGALEEAVPESALAAGRRRVLEQSVEEPLPPPPSVAPPQASAESLSEEAHPPPPSLPPPAAPAGQAGTACHGQPPLGGPPPPPGQGAAARNPTGAAGASGPRHQQKASTARLPPGLSEPPAPPPGLSLPADAGVLSPTRGALGTSPDDLQPEPGGPPSHMPQFSMPPTAPPPPAPTAKAEAAVVSAASPKRSMLPPSTAPPPEPVSRKQARNSPAGAKSVPLEDSSKLDVASPEDTEEIRDQAPSPSSMLTPFVADGPRVSRVRSTCPTVTPIGTGRGAGSRGASKAIAAPLPPGIVAPPPPASAPPPAPGLTLGSVQQVTRPNEQDSPIVAALFVKMDTLSDRDLIRLLGSALGRRHSLHSPVVKALSASPSHFADSGTGES